MKKLVQYGVLTLFVISTLAFIYCALSGTCISMELMQRYALLLKAFVRNHYYFSAALYMALYSLVVSVLFPILAPFTVLGGYLFGVWLGMIYSCLAALGGSLLSFFCFRYFFSEVVQSRYGQKIAWFNERIREDGASYLLILHFLLVPYSVINMCAAVTPVSWWTFSWTTVMGSVPISLVYTFAGTQLHKFEKFSLFSPKVLGILLLFILVIMIPLFIKRLGKRSKEVSGPLA